VAAPPRALAGHQRLEVEYAPVHIPENVSIDQDREESDIDVGEFCLENHKMRERLNPRGFVCDMTNVVFATTKGVQRTERVVGANMRRCNEEIMILDEVSKPSDDKLVCEPAFAAAFSVTIDEGVLKCRRSLSHAFPDPTPNLGEITEVCRHGRNLLTTGVESSRYVMRLAAMYVETAMATRGGVRRMRWDMAVQPPHVALGTWAVFRVAVMNDARLNVERNFVPWSRVEGMTMPQEITYFRVLRIAAADQSSMINQGNVITPMIWPAIPNLSTVSTAPIGLMEQEQVVTDLSAADIYVAARMWVHRYSKPALLDSYIKYLMTMYWCKGEDEFPVRVAVPFCSPILKMPKAQMRPFLMLPYIAGMDDTKSLLNSVGIMDFFGKVSETMANAILIGMSAAWAKWKRIDYVWQSNLVSQRKQEQLIQCLRFKGNGVPIWSSAQLVISQLGYKGKIGKLFNNTACASPVEIYTDYINAGDYRRNTGDCLSFLPKLPYGSAAMGWQSPAPLNEAICQSDQQYFMENVASEYGPLALATIAETPEVDYFYQVTDYAQNHLDINDLPQIPRTPNGFPLDQYYQDVLLENRQVYSFGYILGIRAMFALGDARNDRFHMKWWVKRRGAGIVRTIHLHNPGSKNQAIPAWYTPFGAHTKYTPGGSDNGPSNSSSGGGSPPDTPRRDPFVGQYGGGNIEGGNGKNDDYKNIRPLSPPPAKTLSEVSEHSIPFEYAGEPSQQTLDEEAARLESWKMEEEREERQNFTRGHASIQKPQLDSAGEIALRQAKELFAERDAYIAKAKREREERMKSIKIKEERKLELEDAKRKKDENKAEEQRKMQEATRLDTKHNGENPEDDESLKMIRIEPGVAKQMVRKFSGHWGSDDEAENEQLLEEKGAAVVDDENGENSFEETTGSEEENEAEITRLAALIENATRARMRINPNQRIEKAIKYCIENASVSKEERAIISKTGFAKEVKNVAIFRDREERPTQKRERLQKKNEEKESGGTQQKQFHGKLVRKQKVATPQHWALRTAEQIPVAGPMISNVMSAYKTVKDEIEVVHEMVRERRESTGDTGEEIRGMIEPQATEEEAERSKREAETRGKQKDSKDVRNQDLRPENGDET